MYVYVCACVHVHMCTCMHVCASTCVFYIHVCVCNLSINLDFLHGVVDDIVMLRGQPLVCYFLYHTWSFWMQYSAYNH